jgi:hypothetical protein
MVVLQVNDVHLALRIKDQYRKRYQGYKNCLSEDIEHLSVDVTLLPTLSLLMISKT